MFNVLYKIKLLRQNLFGRRLTLVLKSGARIKLHGVATFNCVIGGSNPSYDIGWKHPGAQNLLVVDPAEIVAVLI